MEVRLFDGAAMNAGFSLGQDRVDTTHVLFERVVDGHRIDRGVDLADRMMVLIGNGRVIQDVIVARALLRAHKCEQFIEQGCALCAFRKIERCNCTRYRQICQFCIVRNIQTVEHVAADIQRLQFRVLRNVDRTEFSRTEADDFQLGVLAQIGSDHETSTRSIEIFQIRCNRKIDLFELITRHNGEFFQAGRKHDRRKAGAAAQVKLLQSITLREIGL